MVYGDKTNPQISTLTQDLKSLVDNWNSPTSEQRKEIEDFFNTIGLTDKFQSATFSLTSTLDVPTYTGSTSIYLSYDWFTVKGIGLNQPATIYSVIYRSFKGTPTSDQVKRGLEPDGTPAVHLQIEFSSDPIEITYTGLDPNINFTIAYFAEVGTRSGYSYETNVVLHKGKTLEYNPQTISGTRIELISVLIFILIFISVI